MVLLRGLQTNLFTVKDLLKDSMDLDKWERGQYEVVVTEHAREVDEDKALENEIRHPAISDAAHPREAP